MRLEDSEIKDLIWAIKYFIETKANEIERSNYLYSEEQKAKVPKLRELADLLGEV